MLTKESVVAFSPKHCQLAINMGDRQTDRQVCLPLAAGIDNDESNTWQVMSRFGRLLALSRKHYRKAAPLRLSYGHCHSATSDCDHNDHVSFCVCHYCAFCEVQTSFSGRVSNVRLRILFCAYGDVVAPEQTSRFLTEITSPGVTCNYIQPKFMYRVSCY